MRRHVAATAARNRRRARLRAGAAVLLAWALPAAAAAQHFPADDDVAEMLRYLVEAGIARGVVFGTIEADGTTRILHSGDAGADALPLGPGSVFEIASITKVFTGALLAEMAGRGDVSLTDPVARHLPAGVRVPSREGREITLVDLATHHSGLPRDADNHNAADPGDPFADFTVARLYDLLAVTTLRRVPGADGGYAYSNVGYGLLGHALARAGSGSYEDVLRERVLAPLGMTRTGVALQGELAERRVRGHGLAGEVVPPWTFTDAIAGAGALHSTAEDLLRFLAASIAAPDTDLGRALRDARMPRMMMGSSARIGLGWHVLDIDDRTVVIHDGGSPGFRASMGFDPDRRVGFVLLMNTTGRDASLGLDLLLRGPVPPLPDLELPAELLASLAGEYEIEPGWLVNVDADDRGLTLRSPGRERMRLHATSDTSFIAKRLPWDLVFTRDERHSTSALILIIDGVCRHGRKVTTDSPAATLPAEPLDLPLDPAGVARYAGTYAVRFGQTMLRVRVFAERGRLMWQAGNAEPRRLRHQGRHAFVHADNAELRVVFAVSGERATGVTIHQSGAIVPGLRVPPPRPPDP